MTFAEFARAVKEIAGNEYCSAEVHANMHIDSTDLCWKAYTDTAGFGGEASTPERALEKLRQKLEGVTPAGPESVGDPAAEIEETF